MENVGTRAWHIIDTQYMLTTIFIIIIFLTTIFLKKLFILCWSTADQQCCDGFRRVVKDLGHTHTCIHSPPNSPPSQAATLH